ncbi:MAG: hypothetical protein ABJA10_09265 [Aestuariivirga sp.]
MNKFIIASLSLALLAGCSTLKRATGQIDDTVLPGQRQEVLSPDQQQARDPSVTGQPEPSSMQPAPPQISPGQPMNEASRANAAPLAPPSDAAAIAACDPKVDLCPEAMAPEPLPPPSPLIPEKKAKTTKGKAAMAQAGTEQIGDGQAAPIKPVKKKIIKKKLPKDVAKLPSEPDATDVTPPVAAPPTPQGQ